MVYLPGWKGMLVARLDAIEIGRCACVGGTGRDTESVIRGVGRIVLLASAHPAAAMLLRVGGFVGSVSV